MLLRSFTAFFRDHKKCNKHYSEYCVLTAYSGTQWAYSFTLVPMYMITGGITLIKSIIFSSNFFFFGCKRELSSVCVCVCDPLPYSFYNQKLLNINPSVFTSAAWRFYDRNTSVIWTNKNPRKTSGLVKN